MKINYRLYLRKFHILFLWQQRIYQNYIQKTSFRNIPKNPDDYRHGTAVDSILVDGARLNPWLNDGCGRFRVRYFGVAGTNKPSADIEKIGSPADSINSMVVNAVTQNGLSTKYARRGLALSFFAKPDISYYGGSEEKYIKVCEPLGEANVADTRRGCLIWTWYSTY